MDDSPQYHWPGGPVYERGVFAALTIDGRVTMTRLFPAGSSLAVMNGVHRWKLVGRTTAGSV